MPFYHKVSLRNLNNIFKNMQNLSQTFYKHNNAAIREANNNYTNTIVNQKCIITKTAPTTAAPKTATFASTVNSIERIKNNIIMVGYNIDWIFPRLRNPSSFWHLATTITVAAVGFFSKLIIVWLNKTKIFNQHILKDAVADRPKGTPLITVSNHHSCFDDPGIWSSLPLKYLCGKNTIRWSLAAHDICFTNKYHSLFFMFGKCIPVIRGAGVYQSAVDLCIQKLSKGDWVHIFPEGRVNVTKEAIRYKWGVGRIIYESPVVPIIVPIWHEGMDSVLPNEPPYLLKFGKKVTINIGQPIDLNNFVENLRKKNIPEPDARKLITDKIQEKMQILSKETEILHARC